jgi:hypothetical protein
MTPGRAHNPEGAKHIVVSYKAADGAILAVARHMYKIVCYADSVSGRLQVDQAATVGGK